MDEQQANAMLEVAKEVAKETYDDVARPVLKPTGETLGLIPRMIKAALLPLEKWIVGREYNLAETVKLLELKLQNVNPNQIAPPDAYIGVPALKYISYCMDSEELRDMYANLLAKSMNEITRNGVHPSFAEIIKQLCPDEAKILRIANNVIPVIKLSYRNAKGEGNDAIRNFSDIGYKSNCEYPDNIPQYIDNMERLGLIGKPWFLTSLVDKSVYQPIKNHPTIKALETQYDTSENPDISTLISEEFYQFTDFGRSFKSICISPFEIISV